MLHAIFLVFSWPEGAAKPFKLRHREAIKLILEALTFLSSCSVVIEFRNFSKISN